MANRRRGGLKAKRSRGRIVFTNSTVAEFTQDLYGVVNSSPRETVLCSQFLLRYAVWALLLKRLNKGIMLGRAVNNLPSKWNE